ncbi:MAG: hypothetical protein HY509_03780 [Acidobacteria bacterium]|nr:hypothetical protein [Acidobacteriota bacterium]
MKVRHALLYGLTSALRQKRTVAALYLLSLLFALLLLAPLLPLVGGTLGRSLAGSGVESRLDLAVAADWLRTHGGELAAFRGFATGAVVVYLLAATFLSGGVVHLLLSPRPERWLAGFLHGCGLHFGRFLRLLLCHLPLLLLVAGANRSGDTVVRYWFEDTPHEVAATLALWGKQGLAILALTGIAAVFDYARIGIALEERRSALRALAAAGRFALANPGAVLAIRLLAFGSAGTILILYVAASRWLLPGAAWISLLLLQQGVILARSFLTVWRYAAELNLYRGRGLTEDARLLSRLTSPAAVRSALS